MPNVGTLYGVLKLDTSQFTSALGSAGSSFGQFGSQLQTAGRQLTTYVTLPLLGLGGAIIKTSVDFDTSLRRIVALTDVTADEIDGIKQAILNLSGEVGRTPQELAEAFYLLASSGFSGKEAFDVLSTAAKAAATGLGTTQDVAKVLGLTINAYGHDNISAAQAADVLTAAIKDGTAEADEFAGTLGRVVPVAAIMGVSFDQVSAAIAGMTLSGLSADEATTALRQVLVSILNPTREADKALADVGTSAADLRAELKEKGLLVFLRDLETRFSGNDTAAGAVFGNVRALTGALGLLGLDADQLNKVFADTAGASGNLGTAFAETEGPGRELDRGMADVQKTLLELGETVLPMAIEVLHTLRDALSDIRDWWDTLDDATKRNVVTFGAIAAAAGPVLLIVGLLVVAITALLTPIGLVVAAIIATIAVLILFGDQIRAAVNGALAEVTRVFNEVVAFLEATWATIVASVTDAWNSVTTAISDALTAAYDSIVGALTSIHDAIVAAFTAVHDNVVAIVTSIHDAIVAAFTAVVDAITSVGEAIAAAVTAAWEVVREIIRGILTVILVIIVAGVTLWNNTIGAYLGTARDQIVAIWDAIASFIAGVLDTIGGIIGSAWASISATISGVLATISSTISSAWNSITGTVSGAVTQTQTTVSSTWNSIASTLSGILNTIRAAVTSAWNAVTGAISSALATAQAAITSAWNSIANFVRSVVASISSAVTSAFNTMSSTINGILNNVRSVFASIWGSIVGVFNSAVSSIGGALNTMGSIFYSAFQGLVSVVKGPLNTVISALNTFIRFWDSIQLSVPSIDLGPLGTIGGYTVRLPYISPIPYLERGTRDWTGGLAMLGERGPELAILPSHSGVLPADMTSRLMELLDDPKSRGGDRPLIGEQNVYGMQPGDVTRETEKALRRTVLTWSLEGRG